MQTRDKVIELEEEINKLVSKFIKETGMRPVISQTETGYQEIKYCEVDLK